MWRDKAAARRSARRTPEKTLLLAALIMGGLGIFIGTRAPLYHKRGKRRFMRLTKIILFGNLILISLIIFLFYFLTILKVNYPIIELCVKGSKTFDSR
ncbi:MAG: DUF1294 domain-containing protein [Saprospiraceae bacterium]|nr:DUF1294 domain-containing protein [Saprospiraceae bacterium]